MFKQLSDVPNTIFVLEESFDRFDGPERSRYKCTLQTLIEAQSLQSDDRTDDEEDQLDAWVASHGRAEEFLGYVARCDTDFVSQLMATGKAYINEEEILFAFGVYKELANEAYMEINEEEDESGWN